MISNVRNGSRAWHVSTAIVTSIPRPSFFYSEVGRQIKEVAIRQLYGWNDLLVLPDDLREFAWSAPMRDLAARIGLSDVGLKKLLTACGVPTPPQGYWNKVHAGKPVPKCPKSPARRPGETGRVRVDARFAGVLKPADPLPSQGPFASAFVPEDLDDLYAQELKAIGRIGVPKGLDRVHRALLQILKQEQRRREKIAQSRWHWDGPKFDNPLDKRRLKILSAVFMALSKRGHEADAYERDGEIHATAIVGDTRLGLEVTVVGNRAARVYGRDRSTADLPLRTPLTLRVDPDFDGKNEVSWQDDEDGTLETKIAHIAAGVIVAGEARFRRSLREAEERAEQQRILEEKRRREELAARNRKRLESLHRSGELLRQAEDIRALVARVREAIIEGSPEADVATIEAWEKWALEEADKIDPIQSGQFLAHLRPAI